MFVHMSVRFLITQTVRYGEAYDCLFEITDQSVQRVCRPLEEHDLPLGEDVEMILDLPVEIQDRIFLFTIQHYLKTCNFDDAYNLICIRTSVVRTVFFWLFGKSKYDVNDKKYILRRVLQICESIYDDFLTVGFEMMGPGLYPCIVFNVASNSLINPTEYLPWDCHPIIEWTPTYVAHHRLGEMFFTGPRMCDHVLIKNCYEKDGINYGTGLASPFVFCLLMKDMVRHVSIFKNKRRLYYFQRFCMLMKYCFGKNFTSFFYTHGKSILHEEDVEEDAAIMLSEYYFKEMEPVQRK